MKKLLSLTLLAASIGVSSFSAEAKTEKTNPLVNNSVVSENSVQPRRRGNQRPRTVLRTRTVRRGFALYRETYRYTYLRNGRVNVRLISRVRVR